MASITKRKSQGGRYYIRWYEKGKVKWKSTGQKTKEKAQDYYDQWILTKRDLYSRDFTVYELFEKRLQYMLTHFRSSTSLIYIRTFKIYKNLFSDRALSKVIPDDLEIYKDRRIKEVTKTTVNIEVRILKATFNYACKLEILNKNPFRNVKSFDIEEKKFVYIPDHHMKLILDHTDNPIVKEVFLHALRTAMRRGEILNLRYRDINLQERTMQILETKTKTPRDIPISDQLFAQLEKYFIDESGNNKFYNPDDFIYKVTGDLCTKRFKKIIRKLKLPESYKFHSLRHTAITNLLRNSGNVRIAQFVAGHKSLKTTQGYLHNIPEEVRAAVNTL